MSKVRLQIDGYTIEALEGQSVMQAALAAGIYIPHLCYHPALSSLGNCKLCCVEIEGEDSLCLSCEKIIEDGMVVNTKTEAVKKRRITALELMLASHPGDCTSCDKYLNCELQALMQYMGVGHSRLREIEKENTRIAKSDSLIKREMQRCIQCGRCVRACEELRGVGVLAVNKKNGETYINTPGDKPLDETDCRFCGACVEVCPTGAIQDKSGVFPANVPSRQAYVPCKSECPAHTDIPSYIRLVNQGRYSEAVCVIREKLTFPHVLGLICTHACESKCKRSHLNEAISIRDLKRYAVENDHEELWKKRRTIQPDNGQKVAIIGGGPAGMTAAYYLAGKGYHPEVYERMAKPGGMMSYGIPKYRLAQDIVDHEISTLTEAGITIYHNADIRKLNELTDKGYDAILIAIGACKGRRPPEYNKPWQNAIDAVDLCRMACEENLPDLGEVVTVYGGGNVGFDCARTAKMNGVRTVRLICMEARSQMLADPEEIREALAEGIEILSGTVITGVDEGGDRVNALTVTDINGFRFTEHGLELDIAAGTERSLETDTMIFATSQQPGLDESFGIELVKGSFAKTDDQGSTNITGVFAAGDVVYGTKSVVQAIASGRDAAMQIDRYLGGDGNIEEVLFEPEDNNQKIGKMAGFAHLERNECLGTCSEAGAESLRCLQCDLRLAIPKDKNWADPHYKTVKEVRG
ncbi:MAG: FAD-dependent oxidoreductase [Lachnospiraceae bacterium]